MQSSVPMSFVFPSATGYGPPPPPSTQTPVLYPPGPPQLNPYAGMPMYAVQHQYYQPGPGGKVYMYQPNEIRHRKRTSRHQLQVLEAVFVDDQKPGPVIRKKLAVELSMTARSVQVWFQNRRAKDKNLQKKAALVAAQQNGQLDAPAATEPELPDGGEGPGSAADAGAHAITDADELTSTHGESASPPPPHGESSAASPASQAGSEHTSRSASASLPRSSPDLAMLRRGSAPALMHDGAAACSAHVPLGPPDAGRRQSLELSFARMQAHPYPSRLSVAPPSSFRRAQLGGNALDMAGQRMQQRRGSAPRVTPLAAPAVFHNPQAPSSGATNVNGPISSSPAFSNNVAGWVNQTAANAAAHTHGFIRAPAPQHLPGPLPAKDFSFGAPPASSNDLPRVGSEESIESPTGDAYSRSGSFASFVDGDLSRAPRFGSFASVSDSDPTHGTRFSSFASAAGSEASASTYYSALPTPDGWAPDSRRSSFVEFTNTLSNLHVGAAPTGERFHKSTSPPQMDPSIFNNYESSPASSNSSTGTMLYASSPPAPPSTGNSDQQAPSKGHHPSEMNYTLMATTSAPVQEAPRQQYNTSNGYYDSSQVPNVQTSSSSSLSGAMGDSALGSAQMQTSSSTSNSLSTSSSSTSLSGLSTPLDLSHPYMGQQPGVVTPESAPVFHAPAPSEQLNFVDTSCFDHQNGFYPTVQVQPPSAGVGGMGLALEQAYPFFSA